MADWPAIRNEYERGDMSCAALARKHGVSASTLRARAARENWIKPQEVSVRHLEKAAGTLMKRLNQILGDEKQFYRYIVKEKTENGQEETEKIFGKADMHAIKEAASAILEMTRLNQALSTDDEEAASGVICLPEREDV